jgi:hypothetical protein
MSFLSNAIAAGLGLIMATAGERVTYYRGDKKIENLLATPGDGQRPSRQSEVVSVTGEQDWMVMVADLDFGDGPVPPERSDRIVSGGITYEVLPRDGDDVYRDPTLVQYRIHSKVICRS